MISNTVIKEEKCLNPLFFQHANGTEFQPWALLNRNLSGMCIFVFLEQAVKLNKLLDQMLGIFAIVIRFVMHCTHSHSPLHYDLDH